MVKVFVLLPSQGHWFPLWLELQVLVFRRWYVYSLYYTINIAEDLCLLSSD
jgi:hypothetical protein